MGKIVEKITKSIKSMKGSPRLRRTIQRLTGLDKTKGSKKAQGYAADKYIRNKFDTTASDAQKQRKNERLNTYKKLKDRKKLTKDIVHTTGALGAAAGIGYAGKKINDKVKNNKK